ncbi:MAG: outer membrane beta-barrel protein, partial [Chitinophagaceae bacterium]
MKQLIVLLIAGFSALSTTAQTKVKNYTEDKDLSRWVLDLNGMGGGYSQQFTMANTAPNYLNGLNINTGNATFVNGSAFGGDLQLGVFFGKNKHLGLGTGILYLRESGDMKLNGFHAEYQSVDRNGNIFRQVVSANNITEQIKSDNFNIPLLLKYKNRFSKHWGFTADAGALFNISMKNAYTTNASFDYEAIYKFDATSEGGNRAIYETSLIPANTDFLITRNQFTKNNPNGSVQQYFDEKNAEGYNVGLGVSPKQQKGSTSYATGSVGFLFQPSINYFFSDHVALNVGGYFLVQPFKNDATNTYTLTGKPGEYNPVINSVSKVQTQSYGGNIGLRFFLGRKSAPLHISGTDPNAPSYCGQCDGSIVFHGLDAGKQA